MPRPPDFIDAHRRHWEDAELLFGYDRWANADQLYGFSAECGLKAAMLAMGMVLNAAGLPGDRGHRKHVQDLWQVFRTFAAHRNGGWYLARLPVADPFRNWTHHDRYASRQQYAEQDVVPHRHAAQSIILMIQTAKLDGRL